MNGPDYEVDYAESSRAGRWIKQIAYAVFWLVLSVVTLKGWGLFAFLAYFVCNKGWRYKENSWS
jgi:hypothetical protein